MSQQTQMPFRDYVIRQRSQIVLAYDSAKEVALRNFDELALKLQEQFQIVEAFKKAKGKEKEVKPKDKKQR